MSENEGWKFTVFDGENTRGVTGKLIRTTEDDEGRTLKIEVALSFVLTADGRSFTVGMIEYISGPGIKNYSRGANCRIPEEGPAVILSQEGTGPIKPEDAGPLARDAARAMVDQLGKDARIMLGYDTPVTQLVPAVLTYAIQDYRAELQGTSVDAPPADVTRSRTR